MFLILKIGGSGYNFLKQLGGRYRKFTDFKATNGVLAIEFEGPRDSCSLKDLKLGENTFFLDARYKTKAEEEDLSYKDFEDLGKLDFSKCIIDPMQWSLEEGLKYGLGRATYKSFEFWGENLPIFENFEYEKTLNIKNLMISAKKNNLTYLVSSPLNLEYLFGVKGFYYALIDSQNCHIRPISELLDPKENIAYDPQNTSLIFENFLRKDNAIKDPIWPKHSVRKAKEMPHLQDFLSHEALAWLKFWEFIEKEYQNLTELQASEKFQEIRASSPHYREEAFEAIVASGSNSAAIHSSPSENLIKGGLFLVDAGTKGEFISDVTRVFWLGDEEPEYELKKDYTAVLKAHIALATAKFGPQTEAKELDSMARKIINKNDQNYTHATGHGVGKLIVHAYPTISSSSADILKVGMQITNEPGIYKTGQYGIRLESMHIVAMQSPWEFYFKYLSFIPFEAKLIDFSILSRKEKAWLSEFHELCYQKLEKNDFLEQKVKSFLFESIPEEKIKEAK